MNIRHLKEKLTKKAVVLRIEVQLLILCMN